MHSSSFNPAPAPARHPTSRPAGDPDIPGGFHSRLGRLQLCVVLIVQVAFATALTMPAQAQGDVTVASLRLAHSRACNSRLYYGAFATCAERQGDFLAAAAFRAVAVGESVHAAIHAEQLEQMGAAPRWTVESVVVRTTAENLKFAIERESYAAREVYPTLNALAAPECQYDALAVLRYAKEAEATHAELFSAVLLAMNSGPPAVGMRLVAFPGDAPVHGTFYTCTGDGRVCLLPPKGRCPSCGYGPGHSRETEYKIPVRTGEARLAAGTGR
jgi:rubrerythrin